MSSGVISGNVKAIGICQLTIDVASVSAATSAEQTFTIYGLNVGDVVFASKPSVSAGLAVASCRVSAANTIAMTFVNASAGAVNPSSETYNILWVRPAGAATAVTE